MDGTINFAEENEQYKGLEVQKPRTQLTSKFYETPKVKTAATVNTNTQSNDFTSEVENVKANATASMKEYWEKKQTAADIIANKRATNSQYYQFNLPPDQYDFLNNRFAQIAKDEGPEAADEARYKYMNAMQYSRLYSIPLEEAMQNVDVYNRSIFNDATEGNYKGKAERLGDALTSGLISLERGWIGAEWKKAEDNGDVEGAKKIKEYIDALDEAAQEFAINQPQAIPMAILTSGIQSLPYTAAVSAAGFVSGKLGGKWLGYVGSIATASLFTMGDEYIELRNMGVEPEVANKIALGSGVVQGTIESFLGNVAGWIGRGAKGVTGGTTKRLSQPLIEKVSKDFYSLFKTGDLGLKAVVKLATEYGTELTEEGLEEFAQQWTSWAGQKLAQALSMNDVEVDNFEEAWEKSKDAFIGGVEGAILLGLPGLAYDVGVTISDFKKVKEDAELIDSKEVFLKAEKDNAIFKNVSEEDYKKVAGEVWDNFSKKRQEAEKELSMEIQEGLAAEEGTEEYEAEGPDGEEELKAEYRQDGRLYTTNNVTGEDTDGKTTGRFAVGNPEEKNNNTFGYLNYTIDEEAGTVTINDFKMAPQREYLRAETYNEFAQQFSGYDIKWDPKTKRVQMMKESLMNLNPRGKEAGLNYFETGSEENHKARVQVAQQLKSEYSFLTDEQAAVDVAVMDILSKRIGMDVSTFFDKAFHNREMFGASEDLEAGIRQAVAEGRLNEGEAVNGAATFKQFNDGMRSIIYTSKNADFSTWSHEVTHVWKNLLTTIADDKTNKQAQDIISKLNAIYDKDFRNWTEKEEEDFVRGFEAYLGSRNNEAGGKFNEVYKQLAKFMAEVYKWLEDHGVTFNEKFKEAYDAMLQTEGSELAQARKAVEEANAQEAQKQQEEAAVKEEATQENLTAETKAEIKEADKIVKDVDYGIEDKVDATVQATSDQYAENVEAEKEEAWEREMEENPDAFDENGDLLIFQRTEAEYKAAWEELETFPLEEKNRIKNNFVKFKGTPWYHAALESLMIRYDLKALMNGTPTCGSKLMGKAGTKLREYIQRAKDTNGDFYEALYDWAAHTGVGLIGQADKAEFAVNSTFLNCDPSMDCAEYCYAATGTYNFAGAAIRSEVVSMVIEMYPERAAEEVFYQYRPTGGNKMGNVLRLFDKGDISENWIPFIEKLNAKGLRTQIFSKRPAILSKVDPVMNVIMLSIDRTNRELAENNKDFPIAFVLQDEEDIKWIERNVDRFRKHGGVILPVQLSNGSIEESKALVKLLPQEIRPYVCPVDGGYAVLKYPENGKSYVENAKELGPIHHCGGCNSKGGIGCLFHRTQMWLESHGQWIDTTPLELKEGEKLYEELEKQRQTIDKAAAEGHLNEELAKQLREQLATLNAGIRKLIDRRGENGSLNGNARRSEETPGINEGRIESEVKFQRVTDPKELEWLNSQPTEKYYRTVIAGEVDGKQAFWPPMSSKVSAAGEKTRKLREPIFLNEWEKAEERPDLVDDKGYFTLAKDNGKSIDALYAPYMHSSPSMLNDQLAESQERPNLAVVEVEVPASELSGEDPYTAPKSKKSVGRYDWKAGVIQSQLTGTREVNLSRWDKIVRVVPPAEVAANIVKEFGDQKIVMPTNVVTPQVRAELEKLGVEFVKTDNKNTLLEGPHAGDKYTWWYGPNAEENRRKGYLKAGREFEQTRFQVTGIKGATNMDLAEEVTTRADNLNIAKEMEAAKKDAKTIKLATGWEKGVDGKWRYEINDKDWKLLTTDWKRINNSVAYLIDLLDAIELYKAYPELMYYSIHLTDKDYAGYFDGQGAIYINPFYNTDEEELKRTLLHEVQHAIQKEEGFARGGSETSIKDDLLDKTIDKLNRSWPGFDKYEQSIHREAIINYLLLTRKLSDNPEYFTKTSYYYEYGSFPGLPKDKSLRRERLVEIIDKWREAMVDRLNTADSSIDEYLHYTDEELKNFSKKEKRVQNEYIDEHFKYLLTGEELKNYREATPYELYSRLAGEVESRNVERRINMTNAERAATLLSETEDVARNDQIIMERAANTLNATRFQTAYHGSAADFEKFDLNYNKSGEGSNAFGYGVYLTGSKVIAKDYAERQGDTKFDKQAPGEYRGQDVAHIRDYMNTGLTFQAAKEKRITYLESNKARYALTYGPNSSMAKVWQNKIDFVKELTEEDLNSRNLYTVEIPEENYLKWDEKVAPIMLEDIKKAVYDYLIQIDNDGDYEGSAKEYLEKELDITFNEYTTGESAYKSVAGFLKSELKASWLLNKIGIKGIDYPAGTHFDTEEDARNYVIFDENLVQIMDHLRFQTEQDLLKDAAQFDSWQNFMEMYTSDFGQAFDHSQVPSGADAVWYQSVWEKARNISPTIGEQLEEMAKQDSLRDKEAPIEDTAMDAMFTAEMRQEGSTMLEDFLREVDNILKTDVDVAAETEEDQKDLQRIESLQRVIRQTLRHGVWLSNAARVNKDKGLTDRMKRQMLTLIEHSVRAYRTIYSEVMNDEYWKPTEEDPSIKKIRGSKYNALAAGKDITNMSPEQLRKIARDITNKEISEKIKNGSLKIETDVENYLKQLESDIKATDKDFEKLQNETAEDYKNMSDWEQRRILEVYDELVLANPKYEKKDKVKNEVAKAIKTAEKYNTNFYKNATANYDTIFRQWEDLRKLVEANAKLKEAIRRRDDLVKLAEERAAKKTEKAAVDRMKEVRKQLVKRAMRRVPFSRIMYDQAKTLIAIQRVFEPNLEGGVNKWIGTEGSWPRMVWSQYLTDADFRDRISKRLLRTKTGIKVLNKLETTKTDEDFNSWTNSERRSLMKVAPKEDWVRDLHLAELDEEREESIDILIEYEERRRSYKDDKGNTKWEKYLLPKFDDEVGKLIKDALGPDMFNTLLYKPFAEWTTNEMELLAKRVDEIYIEGREALAAKREAEKELSKEIRKRIQDAVTNTGIVINDDDPPEVKAEKQKAINKKLGLTSEMKGTAASSLQRENIFNRILHGYSDATVRRVARILDNYSEGVNTNLLYHEEANCYNEEQNQIQRRTKKIQDSMVRNNISPLDLAQPVIFKNFKKGNDIKLTLDELLYFLAANLDEKSRDACAYGNLYDEKEREEYKRLDEDFQKAFEESEEKAKEAGKKGNLQEVQKAQAISSKYVDESGNLQKPGTTAYRAVCDSLWARLMLVTEQDQNGNLIIIPAERGNEARFIPVIAELLTESHFDGKKATAEEKEAYKNQMLEKKFISFIQDVMDDYNVEFDRMSKASIDEFNQPVNRVQRYVPIVRMSMTGDTNENRVRADLLATNAGAQSNAGTDRGMTKKRIDVAALYQRPVEAGLFKTWSDALGRTEHFIAYAPYVRELNRVYMSRNAQSTMQWIESRYGKGMTEYIRDYIQEVANPNRGQVQTATDRFVRSLRGLTAPAYLGWKASSVFKQAVTSPWPFMSEVTPVEYVNALFKQIRNGSTFEEGIKAKSNFMRERRMDPIMDLIDEQVKKNLDSKAKSFLLDMESLGMKPLEWIDWVCVAPGWQAVYTREYNKLMSDNEAKREREAAIIKEKQPGIDDVTLEKMLEEKLMSAVEIEEAAVKAADDVVRMTQPSNRKADLAPIFKNNNEVAKAVLQFTTSLNVIWNNLRYDLPYEVRRENYSKAIKYVTEYALAGICLSLLAGQLPLPGDDKDEVVEKLRALLHGATTQFTDSIPFIGSAVTNVAEKLITGKSQYSSGSDLFPTISKALQGIGNVTQGDWDKAAAKWAEAVGISMGLPVSGSKELLYFFGIGDGEEEFKLHPTAILGQRN